MIILMVWSHTNQRFDVDILVKVLMEEFNSVILEEDCFEAEKHHKRAIIEKLKAAGRPMLHAEAIIEDIEGKKAALGPGKRLHVPLGPSYMEGTVAACCIHLRGPGCLPDDGVEQLRQTLQQQGVRHIEVTDQEDDGPPSVWQD